MNRSWWLYYGRKCGMTKQEIMVTSLGAMSDMVSCVSIFEGGAEPAEPKMSYDEIMNLR